MNKADATLNLERIAFTVDEAAAVLGIANTTVRDYVRAGRIPHLAIGDRIVIGRRALEEWLTHECLSRVKPSQLDNELASLPVRTREAVKAFRNGVAPVGRGRPGDFVLG